MCWGLGARFLAGGVALSGGEQLALDFEPRLVRGAPRAPLRAPQPSALLGDQTRLFFVATAVLFLHPRAGDERLVLGLRFRLVATTGGGLARVVAPGVVVVTGVGLARVWLTGPRGRRLGGWRVGGWRAARVRVLTAQQRVAPPRRLKSAAETHVSRNSKIRIESNLGGIWQRALRYE